MIEADLSGKSYKRMKSITLPNIHGEPACCYISIIYGLASHCISTGAAGFLLTYLVIKRRFLAAIRNPSPSACAWDYVADLG